MSAIDDAVSGNVTYARLEHRPGLDKRPNKRLFVLTCMDSRILVETVLGLHRGEAHVCRNGGPTVTDDVLRSLTLSQHALGTREVMIIGHSDCGLLNLNDEEFGQRVTEETGKTMSRTFPFYGFKDVEQKIRTEMERVRSHRWLHPDTLVRGFVFDVASGYLKEVDPEYVEQKLASD
jgi:carbonic anhydrase